MENHNLPIFYRNPVPLNKEVHASLTVSPSPDGFRFASSTRTVILATAEFFDAAHQFPIIFSSAPDGHILPVALMGLEENENLFVGRDGVWLGQYIPAYVRRYPFITTDGSDGQSMVCIDEDFDGFNLENGLSLFEDGEPTSKAKEIQAFLQDYLVQMLQTEQFSAMLLQNGLLRQIDVQANMNNHRSYPLNGMLVVDEEKMTQLPDSDIVTLFRSGAMALIHAHLFSLRNLNALIERKAKQITKL